MKINKIAKSEGIENIEMLSEFEVNKISDKVANKLAPLFSDFGITYEYLFSVLSKLTMFYGDFKSKNISAVYHFKANIIFINKLFDIECPDSIIVHECIHYLQSEIHNGKIIKMGLFYPNKFNLKGLALNEAAVQSISANVSGIKPSNMKYFGMDFSTPSPDFYPIITALIRQMTHFTGTYPLYQSTIYSTNLFKEVFERMSSPEAFNKISKNMNQIIKKQDEFSKLVDEQKKEELKSSIQYLVADTQEAIFKQAFNKKYFNLKNIQEIKDLRTELLNFENILIKIPGDTSFEEFKQTLTSNLIHLEIECIENGNVLNYTVQKSMIPTMDYGLQFFKQLYEKLKLSIEIRLRIRQDDHFY